MYILLPICTFSNASKFIILTNLSFKIVEANSIDFIVLRGSTKVFVYVCVKDQGRIGSNCYLGKYLFLIFPYTSFKLNFSNSNFSLYCDVFVYMKMFSVM